MKYNRLLMIILYILLSELSFSQTEKGKLWLSGSTQFGLSQGGYKMELFTADSTISTAKYKHFTTDLQPKIGYTIIPNLPVGLFMDCKYYAFKSKEYDSRNRSVDVSAGPFIRYYYADLVGLKPYVEGMIGWGTSITKAKTSGQDSWSEIKNHLFTYRVGTGLTYYLNDHLGIDLFLGFKHDRYYNKNVDLSEDANVEMKRYYNDFVMQLGLVGMIKCRR